MKFRLNPGIHLAKRGKKYVCAHGTDMSNPLQMMAAIGADDVAAVDPRET